jgi:hypothetical protein
MKIPIGTPIINMASPNAAKELKAALGIKSGEVIEIMTPQFARADGMKVAAPLADPHFWDTLHTSGELYLRAIGLQQWDESEKGILWLFPFEWYASIPDGFQITDISGNRKQFTKGVTDDDHRFGALSYGIFVASKVGSGTA